MRRKLSEYSGVGILMVIIGLLVAAPLLFFFFYPQDTRYIPAFLIPSGGSLILGLLLCRFKKPGRENNFNWESNMRVSSLTVLFAWLWGVLIGALPFLLGGQLTFVQSLFEAVSGWTTTGLSVMNVAETPMIYLFHRSFMQYCGGLGFILLMMLLATGKRSMSLFSAEGHPDKLMPNLKKTAQAIFLIYNICLVLGVIAYRIAGMNLFDGICHSMCSLSTGGFSTKLNSIGEYDSFAIEFITIVLMLIGTTNFAALLLLARGRVRSFFKVSEVRFMFLLLIIFVPLVGLSLADGLGISFLEGLRKSAFDVVSAMSTSGYSTMSYADWPHFAIGVLILMMIIGGGIGSTAGGMKLSRVYVAMRMTIINAKRRLFPSSRVDAPHFMKAQGKTPIDRDLEEETASYLMSYLLIFFAGSLLITVTAGCTLTEAMFDFASSLSTVGLSIGITNPMTNTPTLIVEMVGMLLGRLEIFIALIGLSSCVRAVRNWIRRFRKDRA